MRNILLLGSLYLLSGCCLKEPRDPFSRVKREDVVKIAIGRTEKMESADRGRWPVFAFKSLEDIFDRKLVQEIAGELIDEEPTWARLYYYDSMSLVFFDRKDNTVMAVEYFVISKPSGGCSPRKIVIRDGELCLESPKQMSVLISNRLEKLIGWRFTEPVRL